MDQNDNFKISFFNFLKTFLKLLKALKLKFLKAFLKKLQVNFTSFEQTHIKMDTEKMNTHKMKITELTLILTAGNLL